MKRKIDKHRQMIHSSYWQYHSAVCALDALLKANKSRVDNVLSKPIDEAIESLIDAAQQIKAARDNVYRQPNRVIYGKRDNCL